MASGCHTYIWASPETYGISIRTETKSNDRFWPIAVSRSHEGVAWNPINPGRASPMSESLRTIVKCQDPGDGSGDVIIDLQQDLLAEMNVVLGDSLSKELIGGSIVLKLVRDTDTQS